MRTSIGTTLMSVLRLESNGNGRSRRGFTTGPRPPPPSNTSNTGRGSRKRRRLSTVPEAKEHKTALQPCAPGAHESVGIVGVDTALKLRSVEEMNSQSKVLRYLGDSPWDNFEPVPDQMIDSDD